MEFHVTDRGPSNPDEARLHYAGEPFFTTKPPGKAVPDSDCSRSASSPQRMGGDFELMRSPPAEPAVLRIPASSGKTLT